MNHILVLAIVFVIAFGAALLLLALMLPDASQSRTRRRVLSQPLSPADSSQWIERVARLSGPLSKLSLPTGSWETSPLRTRFMNAGLWDQMAPPLYFAAKTALTFVFPILLILVLWHEHVSASFAATSAEIAAFALAGYLLPNVVLGHLIKRRQLELFLAFPDALDLVRICVEAGLGLDAAIARVGQEMAVQSPALAEELHLVTLSIRAGSSREKALKDFALRTGLDEVDALTVVLVQADRFGTSVAQSLRVHSDSLRSTRRQRAEEAAARMATKLLFPLIFCVFPALLLVLLGPAFLSISRSLLPVLAGSQ